MRLIDADALIAEYDKVHVGPAGGARKLMEDAPTIKPESNCSEFPNNWIPCTPETMPECGQEVLTRDTYGGIWICSLLFTGRNNEAYWEDNYGYLYNLDEQIAWMPLPEPYGGEQE